MKKIKNERYLETYYTETMENGLRVVLWHKPNYAKSLFMLATPLGAMDLLQEDENGKQYAYPAGIAHFLEHKMFEKQDQDVMNDFSKMGANVNAFTSYNETAYYFSTSGEIEKPLHLLLDFVQTLDISEASVEKEKGIIVSELKMYQQMSDSRLLMELYKSLFWNHPLKYDIGGDEASVCATTKEQLDACYMHNYHPSTMMLIGVSGKDPEKIFSIIRQNQQQKTFEELCPIHRKTIKEPMEVARKHYQFSMDITVPKIAIAYKLSPCVDVMQRLRQEWCVRLAQDLCFSSLNPDYQRWMDEGIISDFVGADIDYGEDYGVLMFYTETWKQDVFEQVVKKVCDQMAHIDVDEEQLMQLKHRYFGQAIRSLNSFDDIAIGYIRSSFAGYDYFAGMDLINTITIAEIRETCHKLCLDHQSIVTIIPN